MTEDKKFVITEVCIMLGCSQKTVENWYMWKRQNPEHEMAKLLPDFEQSGDRQTRYWTQSDVYRIAEFQSKLPKGRNGILGSVTQKWSKK